MGILVDDMVRIGRAEMEQIIGLSAHGSFVPVIDRVFAFADAAAAHHYLQDRKNFGKVLLQP